MKALSIRQPWASLIVMGMPVFNPLQNEDGKTSRVEFSGKMLVKNIENRTWPLPKWFKVPQRIYVHASKKSDGDEALLWLLKMGLPAFPVLMMFSNRIPRGAIIGEVDIVGCIAESPSPWFVGPYGFLLANPQHYAEPIFCKGKRRFFEPEYDVSPN